MYLLPKRYRKKTKIQLDIGIERQRFNREGEKFFSFKILFAFCLLEGSFIGKECNLASIIFCTAFRISLILSHANYGWGRPGRKKWKNLSIKLSLSHKKLNGTWIEHNYINNLYCQHDVFLFPSLHDSGGQVVLEAISWSTGCVF